MPSFESLNSIFVHVPKAGGVSVYHTAKQWGRVVRVAPPVKVHQPASFFASHKPAWCLIRHPFEWYVSLWRFYVDTKWVWEEPKRRGLDFPEWMNHTVSRYTAELQALEVESISPDRRWRYEAIQLAYDEMIGGNVLLLRRNLSNAESPMLTMEHRRQIEQQDQLAFSLYEQAMVR